MKKAMLNITVMLATAVVIAVFSGPATAKVTGVCSNCHTMHNSQDGSIINEGTKTQDRQSLIAKNCIGCHCRTDGNWKDPVTGAPIVYNTSPPNYGASWQGGPNQGLAAGNFYFVQALGDGYGHNVITTDGTLSHAPGGPTCGFGGCHASLASIRLAPGPGTYDGNGCIGCHDANGAHHADDSGLIVDESGGGYRFLNKAGMRYWDIPPHSSRPAVEGIEDDDWEWSVGPADHNEYRDAEKPFAPCAPGSSTAQGISDFCGGCHSDYHSWLSLDPDPNGNYDSGWLRHPAGVTLAPDGTGECASYNNGTLIYDPIAPVARNELTVVLSTVDPTTDRVMCLSCHRAHASPYPDMLRWNYSDMIAGDTSKSGGCFTCHTQKNNAS